MTGRVFISSGQRPPKETEIVNKIRDLLKNEFNLESYVAFKVQGLNDIMKITEELKYSDYYLFIDFFRKESTDFQYSLFTHQELALAHHMEFSEIIAFQQEGVPLEGFLKYVQSNPESFKNEKELLEKIRISIKERNWCTEYSRNLIISKVSKSNPIIYSDHRSRFHGCIWHAKIENKRPDIAAVGTLCVLDFIELESGERKKVDDKGYLKWASLYQGYNQTILPEDCAKLDILAIDRETRGLFLNSSRDVGSREPIITEDGVYIFYYKVFSSGFPLLKFAISIDYKYSACDGDSWMNSTKVELCAKCS